MDDGNAYPHDVAMDDRARIKKTLERFGITQAEVAEATGIAAHKLNKTLNLTRRLQIHEKDEIERYIRRKTNNLQRDIGTATDSGGFDLEKSKVKDEGGAPLNIRQLRGVRVVGQVQGGAFRDHPEWPREDQYEVMFEASARLRGYPLFGVKVVGPSMNQKFPEGSVAVCVRLLDLGEYEIPSGQYVVVYRRNELGEIEATIKQYIITAGEAWLWPRSDHPEFQQPIPVHALVASRDKDANDDVRIWAVVVGKTEEYAL